MVVLERNLDADDVEDQAVIIASDGGDPHGGLAVSRVLVVAGVVGERVRGAGVRHRRLEIGLLRLLDLRLRLGFALARPGGPVDGLQAEQPVERVAHDERGHRPGVRRVGERDDADLLVGQPLHRGDETVDAAAVADVLAAPVAAHHEAQPVAGIADLGAVLQPLPLRSGHHHLR